MPSGNWATNSDIRSETVMLVSEQNGKPEKMPRTQAQRQADERGEDLVQVSKSGDVPVVKILDYGKFLYERKKRDKQNQSSRSLETKLVRFNQNIGTNDIDIKVRHIKDFLVKGHKVRCVVRRRGRERASPELAEKLLTDIAARVDGHARTPSKPAAGKQDRHSLEILFTPALQK